MPLPFGAPLQPSEGGGGVWSRIVGIQGLVGVVFWGLLDLVLLGLAGTWLGAAFWLPFW